MKSTGVAYLLWLPSLFFVCGLQRFYVGKPVTGLIWLFTFGLLGVGQLLDLVLIPGMVESANLNLAVYGRGGIHSTNNIVANVVNQNGGSEKRGPTQEDFSPRRGRR